VVTVFATGALASYFGHDYAKIGTLTSFVFAIGLVTILMAPDTTRRQLED
jgi:hypothetical protein